MYNIASTVFHVEHISILEGGPNYESPQLFRVNTQRQPALYFLARVADLPNPPGKVPSFKRLWNPTLTSKSTTLGWATRPAPRDTPLVGRWSSAYSNALLGVLTVACLLPFSSRAFHIDDPLFVFAARQITQHPLDPYGFNVIWYESLDRMADVTMNPPLACYYGAAVGRIAGWSERAFHLAFLVPALALIFGTYRMAKHFTRLPLLAGLATVLTPGILVSACSVMCDTMMVALWVWAVILWIEGIEPRKAWYLAGSGVLIAAAVLTKYFGAALILVLAAYSLARLRRFGSWMWYLLIPVGARVGPEFIAHERADRNQQIPHPASETAQSCQGVSRQQENQRRPEILRQNGRRDQNSRPCQIPGLSRLNAFDPKNHRPHP